MRDVLKQALLALALCALPAMAAAQTPSDREVPASERGAELAPDEQAHDARPPDAEGDAIRTTNAPSYEDDSDISTSTRRRSYESTSDEPAPVAEPSYEDEIDEPSLTQPGFHLEDFEFPVRDEPWLLGDDALREAGWEFRDQSFRRGSALAGLAALTVGIPFHGVGHLLVGDNDSMFRLLLSEVLALGVTGLGTIMRDAAPHRNGVWATGAALQVAGLSVFAAGWLTDVVGSFKGTTVPLARNSGDLKGAAVDVHYTVLFSNEVDVTSVGVVGLHWSGDRFAIRPVFSFGPGEGYYRGDLHAEYRHPIFAGGQTYMSVWGEVGEEIFGRAGWGREIALAGLGVSVDMGDLLEHTRGLVWKLRVGAGVQSFHYQTQGHRRFLPGNTRVLVPVETSIAMNVNRGLNVELGYRHRPDDLAGTIARSGGTLFQQFTVLPINRLGIAMRLEQGAYLRLWVGLRYFITTPTL